MLRTKFVLLFVAALMMGCASRGSKDDQGFFTSGSREADQRAEQRMAKAEQQTGETQNGNKPSEKQTAEDTKKLTLFERLGNEKGLQAIVEDFVPRAMADPRVNWDRKGVTRGGFSIHHNESVEWKPNADAIAKLKQHMVEFLSVATGGPTKYTGGEMKQVHTGMHISNANFDAAVGDLKQTLDKLQVPNPEQKELLSIVESTRTQIVEEK